MNISHIWRISELDADSNLIISLYNGPNQKPGASDAWTLQFGSLSGHYWSVVDGTSAVEVKVFMVCYFILWDIQFPRLGCKLMLLSDAEIKQKLDNKCKWENAAWLLNKCLHIVQTFSKEGLALVWNSGDPFTVLIQISSMTLGNLLNFSVPWFSNGKMRINTLPFSHSSSILSI